MMNSVKIVKTSGGSFIEELDYTYNDEWFNEFIGYLLEQPIWRNFIDPCIRNSDTYSCGSLYCIRAEYPNILITDIHTLDTFGSDEAVPLIMKASTIYGMLVALKFMKQQKVPEFTITNEGQRYTFTAQGIEPIVIDPDLGNLYNDTIPYIIVRRHNGTFTWDVHNYNKVDDMFIHSMPIKPGLELLCSLVIQNYNPNLLRTVSRWVKDGEQTTGKQRVTYNNVSISNLYNFVNIEPALEKDRKIRLGTVNLLLGVYQSFTKTSFLSFLQAWESRLQYCDAFTLVFLGNTLRFFEGEPLTNIHCLKSEKWSLTRYQTNLGRPPFRFTRTKK